MGAPAQWDDIGGIAHAALRLAIYTPFAHCLAQANRDAVAVVGGAHAQGELGKGILAEVIHTRQRSGTGIPERLLPGLHQGVMAEAGVLHGGGDKLHGTCPAALAPDGTACIGTGPRLHSPPITRACLQRGTFKGHAHRLDRLSHAAVPHIGLALAEQPRLGGHQHTPGCLAGAGGQLPPQCRSAGTHPSCHPIGSSGSALHHIHGESVGPVPPALSPTAHDRQRHQHEKQPQRASHGRTQDTPPRGADRTVSHSRAFHFSIHYLYIREPMSSSRRATYMAPPVLPACKFTKIRSNMPANGLKNVLLTKFTVLDPAFAIMPKQAVHRTPSFLERGGKRHSTYRTKRCPEKRSTLQCPMQRAAMTNGARCDGHCTALRYLSEKRPCGK